MKLSIVLTVALAAISALGAATASAPLAITVHTDRQGPEINPAMWGIFFEDINFGADGGLYAELVKNGSFDFPNPLMGWTGLPGNSPTGSISAREGDSFSPSKPHYTRLISTSDTGFGVSNEGFSGMGLHEGETYDLSLRARAVEAGDNKLIAALVSASGQVLASAEMEIRGSQWEQRTGVLLAKATEAKASLRLTFSGKGTVDLATVSLFPRHTWKDRPGGLRADMAQMLADLKPGFMRFPGGCIVEGSQLDRRYQWKNTVGPRDERKLLINRWNYEFKHRPAPDYFQSFGLGFFEFFQLCEDIGAEALPILNCGMACQFNSGELVPMDQLEPFIQDALDLIEFANGAPETVWGSRRAALGHPSPFGLKMMGVGNEQWGPQYIERYAAFAKALKARYPAIKLVSAAGPSPADDRFNFLWPKLREERADIVDEHCYANPIWFLASTHRYDQYDRSGPKVFMGEYAAQSVFVVSPSNRNTLECALAEAAFMTGLERNADVVRMASYAPLFAHAERWQWTPDLIWVDNLRVCGTPSYYAQQLFCRNRGKAVLPVEVSGAQIEPQPAGRIGLGTFQTSAEFKDVKVTRGGGELLRSDFSASSEGWSPSAGNWSVKDGALLQTDSLAAAFTFAGNQSWSDYSLALKARKLAGKEGFLIVVRDAGSGTRVQWNLGGWGNQAHGIQLLLGGQEQVLERVPGSIDSGRFYDIKLELHGAKLDCYLDGKLIQSAQIPPPRVERLYASAVRGEAPGETIIKVVNPWPEAASATLTCDGQMPPTSGTAVVLAGSALSDENTLDAPTKVMPINESLDQVKGSFRYSFRPYSLTVLRLTRQSLNRASR